MELPCSLFYDTFLPCSFNNYETFQLTLMGFDNVASANTHWERIKEILWFTLKLKLYTNLNENHRRKLEIEPEMKSRQNDFFFFFLN